MFLWFGARSEAKSVPGGEKRRAHCPTCKVHRRFIEVEVVDKLTVVSVVPLFEAKSKEFRCVECGGVGEFKQDGMSSEQCEQERIAHDQAAVARRAREKRKMEERTETELAALKKKMGLDTESDEGAVAASAPNANANRKRGFRFWRRNR